MTELIKLIVGSVEIWGGLSQYWMTCTEEILSESRRASLRILKRFSLNLGDCFRILERPSQNLGEIFIEFWTDFLRIMTDSLRKIGEDSFRMNWRKSLRILETFSQNHEEIASEYWRDCLRILGQIIPESWTDSLRILYRLKRFYQNL